MVGGGWYLEQPCGAQVGLVGVDEGELGGGDRVRVECLVIGLGLGLGLGLGVRVRVKG